MNFTVAHRASSGSQKKKWRRKISATRCVIKNIFPYARCIGGDNYIPCTRAFVMCLMRKIIPR